MRAVVRIAIRLGLVVGAILVVLSVLEVVLRLRPTLLGQTFANGALSRYTVRAGGIYYGDRNLRMNFMIPSHQTTMYTDHAIAYMSFLIRRHAARLLIVPITTGPQFEILREIAARHGATFVDTTELQRGPAFLPNDGHFSPEGARRLAATIAEVLAQQR